MIRLRLLAVLLLVATTTTHSQRVWAPAYGSNNQWWKCNLEAQKGCEGGSLSSLGLTDSEMSYVTQVLNRAPWPPESATPERIVAYFGSEPITNVGVKLIFDKDKHGLCSGCGVSVYLAHGKILMVHWYVRDKFLFVRQDPRVVGEPLR
jgi:hypothetical protein